MIKFKTLITETPNIIIGFVLVLLLWHGGRFIYGYFADMQQAEKVNALGERLQQEIQLKQSLMKKQEQFDAQERAANYAGQLEFTTHIKNIHSMSPETDAIISTPLPKEFTDEIHRFDEATKW